MRISKISILLLLLTATSENRAFAYASGGTAADIGNAANSIGQNATDGMTVVGDKSVVAQISEQLKTLRYQLVAAQTQFERDRINQEIEKWLKKLKNAQNRLYNDQLTFALSENQSEEAVNNFDEQVLQNESSGASNSDSVFPIAGGTGSVTKGTLDNAAANVGAAAASNPAAALAAPGPSATNPNTVTSAVVTPVDNSLTQPSSVAAATSPAEQSAVGTSLPLPANTADNSANNSNSAASISQATPVSGQPQSPDTVSQNPVSARNTAVGESIIQAQVQPTATANSESPTYNITAVSDPDAQARAQIAAYGYQPVPLDYRGAVDTQTPPAALAKVDAAIASINTGTPAALAKKAPVSPENTAVVTAAGSPPEGTESALPNKKVRIEPTNTGTTVDPRTDKGSIAAAVNDVKINIPDSSLDPMGNPPIAAAKLPSEPSVNKDSFATAPAIATRESISYPKVVSSEAQAVAQAPAAPSLEKPREKLLEKPSPQVQVTVATNTVFPVTSPASLDRQPASNSLSAMAAANNSLTPMPVETASEDVSETEGRPSLLKRLYGVFDAVVSKGGLYNALVSL